jgi:O-antigen ligase
VNERSDKSGNLLRLIAPSAAALSIVALAPYMLMDSVSPIKFFLIVTFALGFLVILLFNLKTIKAFKNNIILWITLSFAFLSTIVVFYTQNALSQQLYGVIGRQTGLILHMALCGLLIAGNLFASNEVLEKTIRLFLITGVLAGLYGIIQILDLDPLTWSSNENWVAATLANPNFYSAFMGMFVCVMLPYLFVNSTVKVKLTFLLGILLAIYIIIKTSSQQGLILVLLGVVITLFFVVKSKNLGKKWLISYSFLALSGVVVLILDILQKVPWQPFLYKTSVSARGDYWRAGIAMIEKYPLTGAGFDGLRDQYGLVREQVSLTRGDQLDLDAAHNIFIDKGIAGGIPLLLLYILIILVVLNAIRRLVIDFKVYNPAMVSVISCWIAWLAQSVISIDNVGLASWGWYLSGLITGLAVISKSPDVRFSKIGSRFELKHTTRLYLVGMVIGALIAMPLVTREYRFVKSIERGDAQGLQNAALQFPQDVFRIGRAAEILKEYKIEKESIYLARQGLKNFPESYSAWAVLYTSPWATEQERAQAKGKLLELDQLRAKYQGLG